MFPFILGNPMWLLGLPAAGIPVLIHLIYRRKAPRILFSTLRFIKLSHEKTARVRKIHDLLLLLMRAALFALLALALAGPIFQRKAKSASRNVAAAVILDNSCSMAAVYDGRSRFAHAKHAAAQILKEWLGSADEAVILLTNPLAEATAPGATADIDEAAEQLAAAQISNGRGNLLPIIQLAREILSKSQKPNHEIYVVTDMQKSAFDVGEITSDATVPTFIVDVGRTGLKNLAVVGCNIRSRALIVKAPVTIEAKIANFSPKAEEQTIGLYINRRKVDQKIVNIDPLSELTVPFNRHFELPGRYIGHIVLQQDSMPIDNRRSFQLDIGDRIPTLIVQDRDSPVAFTDESFFLRPAIDPRPGSESSSTLHYEKILTASFGAADLSKYRTIFLLNVQSLRATAMAAIRRYVADGGGLIVFVGDRVDPDHYTSVLGDDTSALGPMMPVKLRPPVENATGDRPFARLADIVYEHPALTLLRGTNIHQRIHVTRSMPAELAGGTSARVLIKLDNGLPFLIESRYGSGSVFLFTVTANAEWTNFPLKKGYAPIIHELVRYVGRRGRARSAYIVDSTVTLRFPDRSEPLKLTVTTPSGEPLKLTTDPARNPNSADFNKTQQPGVYRWQVDGHKDPAGAFVVNIAAEESQLAKATPDFVNERCGKTGVYITDSIEEMRPIVTRYRKGVPLWDIIFFLLLLTALFESFFSNIVMPKAQVPEEGARGVVSSAL